MGQMGDRSRGEHIDAEVEFDHYNLHISRYSGKLAEYAMGRLMRRLEWHFEQSIVLFAEVSCQNLRSSPALLKKPREAAVLKQILQSIGREARRQHELCRRVSEQLIGIFEATAPSKVPWIGAHLKNLFRDRPPRFAKDANDLASTLRELGAGRDFDQERRVGLDHFVRTYAAIIAPVRQELPCDSATFELGESIERTLCPENVHIHMGIHGNSADVLYAGLDSDALHERVADAAGLVLGFHSFSPGSIRVTSVSWSLLRQAFEKTSPWRSVAQLCPTSLQPQPGGFSSRGGVDSGTSDQRRPAADPDTELNDVLPIFNCCIPSSAEIERDFAHLHAVLEGALRAKTSTSVMNFLIERLRSDPPDLNERKQPSVIKQPRESKTEPNLARAIGATAKSSPLEKSEFIFAKNGDGYFIAGYGAEGHFQKLKGFAMLARLIETPNRPVLMRTLVAEFEVPQPNADFHSRQPVLDEEYRQGIERRVEQLEAHIEQARNSGEFAEAMTYAEEVTKLNQQLTSDNGIRHQSRDLNAQANRLRPSIRAALNRAYKKLRGADPPLSRLAEHFGKSIRAVGNSYRYGPEGGAPAWLFSSPAK